MLPVGARSPQDCLDVAIPAASEQREWRLAVESAVRSEYERHQCPDVAIAIVEHLSQLTQAG